MHEYLVIGSQRMPKRLPAADAIRHFLDTTGWTQAQFADWAGVGQTAVAKWLAGERVPGAERACVIDERSRRNESLPRLTKEQLRPDLFARTKD